ncbi:M15 family metallopeptidase [Actinoplanes sp. NPDC051513]|uniref:M15 family metallopeptidase n=1 Tax=Actinoplanes sp. NPDC051513 TaxID=3363908 RepID=UPI003792A4F6
MRFSMSDYKTGPRAKGWGQGWSADRSKDQARVRADRSGTKVNVHKRIAALVDILLDESERRGYRFNPKSCGGYVNRAIKGTSRPSNHSWGLAVDLNWDRNPENFHGVLKTDFPAWMVPLWNRYGFAWGGHYRGRHKDPMHFEFMGAPADADDMLAKARREILKRNPVPQQVKPQPPTARKYTVKSGDNLSSIADNLKVGGGWNAIYQRNKAVIGPDPDKIKPGMVLTLP